MNKGKMSESALKRSVLKTLITDNKRSEAGIGTDAGLFEAKGEKFLMASASVFGEEKGNGTVCSLRAINSLAASGGKAVAMSLMITASDNDAEGFAKRIMNEVIKVCNACNVTLASGNTLIGNEASVSVTVVGEQLHELKKPSRDRDRILIMKGFAGNSGAAMLAERFAEKLQERFTEDFVNKAISALSDSGCFREADELASETDGIIAMHDISEGGVFGAMWELLEREKAGCKADLKKIPIRQSAIEVCEILDVSPYQLRGDGGLLAIVEDTPENRKLGTVIGTIDNTADRIIVNGDEKRFLEPNRYDSYYAI